ncbi:cation:proton antiporter [Candidatus Woesearchaeota archaeon]|nr:cation:proton antiporter [Candidatus Woesearchaeota archaeon]
MEQFGILLLVIVAISFLIKYFKQPIIMGYVLAGLLFATFGAYYKVQSETIQTMSELGITFLLFLIGLEFDLKSLKYLGKDIFYSLVLQSLVFFLIPLWVGKLFGFTIMESVYIGILFMFSSTLLVAKWLEDKKETSTLHGKIILGTLIVQDIIAILALSILSVLQETSFIAILTAPFKGLLLILIAFVLAKYILNHILKFASRYPELLFITSIGVCFFFVVISPYLGYSTTIGAFIGGITLANTIYKNDIAVRLRPIIIFFNMLFFVGLGFQMDLHLNVMHLIFVVIFIALSMLLKPLAIYITLRMRGYDMKTAFLSGLYLSQLSEFGIIIVAAGVFAKNISGVISSIAVISVIVTMILSSYYIKYDKRIYNRCQKLLLYTEKWFKTKEQVQETVDPGCNILFFGYYDLGQELFAKLRQMGKKIVVIEQDPVSIELLKRENIPYIYNSIHNPEFFEALNLANVELAVSSIIDAEDNKQLIKQIKHANQKAIVIVTAKNMKEALELYNAQADYVINPSYLNEQHVSVLLEEFTHDITKVIGKKIEDITAFKEKEAKRKQVQEEQNRFIDIDAFFNTHLKRSKSKQAVQVAAKTSSPEPVSSDIKRS